MSEKKVRVGVIGIGNMGSAHAKIIFLGEAPDLELTAVADVNPDRLEWAKEEFEGKVACFSDAKDLVESGLVDACVIAVPHYSHPELAILAMEHGLHVMVEKPAGVYTKQVREMIAAADAHPEAVFGMMFNQRTNPIYGKMRELVQSGEFGALRRVNWVITTWYRPQAYYNSGSWRATWEGEGGGALLNQCPHQLDLLQWICGMPVKMQAHLQFGRWHDIEVEDEVTAYMEFENGATGTFVTSTGDACGSNRLEIQLDGGKLLAEDGRLEITKTAVPEQEFTKNNRDAFGVPERTVTVYEPEMKKTPQHLDVLKAWGGKILRDEPLIADGREGINGLLMSNSMHLSTWLDRAVEIPFDEDLYYEELQKRVEESKRRRAEKNAEQQDVAEKKTTSRPTGEYRERWSTNW